MLKGWKVWGVLLLAVILAAEIMLPTVLSEVLAQSVKGMTASDSVSAQLSGRPAVLMLGGHFDQISLKAQNSKLDKIAFNELQAELKNVQLDMTALLNRQLVIKTVDAIQMTATITQDELARYINANVKGAKGAKVDITPEGVRVSSRLALGNIATVEVNLEGQIVSDGQKVKFKTEKFAVNNALVGNFGGAMLTEISLLDLKKLPFGVTVREIKTDTGEVKIYADNNGGRI